MSGNRKQEERSFQGRGIKLSPLPVAVRLDMSIPAGLGRSVEASRVLWVLPRHNEPWVRGFESLIHPN
jgi:hypothetical protein